MKLYMLRVPLQAGRHPARHHEPIANEGLMCIMAENFGLGLDMKLFEGKSGLLVKIRVGEKNGFEFRRLFSIEISGKSPTYPRLFLLQEHRDRLRAHPAGREAPCGVAWYQDIWVCPLDYSK